MDLWQRAKGLAEEAAKRSQLLSNEAAKRSQEISNKLFSQQFVADTAKKSKELATEATKKADLLASEARRAADQIRTLAIDTIPIQLPTIPAVAADPEPNEDLETFGITEELREFVRGITISTFRDFPMQDEPEMSEIQTVSNVRQDLNQWQARHATLVLSTVKEISKFRYELCPRSMKERKFWRIYFILVGNYVTPYEKRYMEELKTKEDLETKAEEKQTDAVKENSIVVNAEAKQTKLQSKTSTSSTAEQDLDVFLLGDLGSDDDGPDVGDDGLDDDFNRIGSTSVLDSDDDDDRKPKQSS